MNSGCLEGILCLKNVLFFVIIFNKSRLNSPKINLYDFHFNAEKHLSYSCLIVFYFSLLHLKRLLCLNVGSGRHTPDRQHRAGGCTVTEMFSDDKKLDIIKKKKSIPAGKGKNVKVW